MPSADSRLRIEPPDLPELERWTYDRLAGRGELVLDGVLLELEPARPIQAGRVRVVESELSGLVLEAADAPGLKLTDVVLRDGDLSNVDGREGSLNRVEVSDSRLVGFGLQGGTVRDVRVVGSTLALASFAFAQLRNVVFEGVKLTGASFMEARLERVEFVNCELFDSDFRGVRLKDCAVRGAPLDGILGIASMQGLAMPWADVLASAAALAAGVGITIESE